MEHRRREYITIGAAWATQVETLERGTLNCFSVKIDNPAMGRDGSYLAMPWLPKKDQLRSTI